MVKIPGSPSVSPQRVEDREGNTFNPCLTHGINVPITSPWHPTGCQVEICQAPSVGKLSPLRTHMQREPARGVIR